MGGYDDPYSPGGRVKKGPSTKGGGGNGKVGGQAASTVKAQAQHSAGSWSTPLANTQRAANTNHSASVQQSGYGKKTPSQLTSAGASPPRSSPGSKSRIQQSTPHKPPAPTCTGKASPTGSPGNNKQIVTKADNRVRASGKISTNHFKILDAATPIVFYQYRLNFTRRLTTEELQKQNEKKLRATKISNNKQTTSVPNPGPPAGSNNALNGPSPKARRRLVYLLLKRLKGLPATTNTNIASDYNSTLITTSPIPAAALVVHTIVLYGEHQTLNPHSPRYDIDIRPDTNNPQLPLAPLLSPASGSVNPISLGQRNQTIRALDIVFTQRTNAGRFSDHIPAMNTKVQSVGRASSNKFFDLTQVPTVLGGEWSSFSAYVGFFISSRAPETFSRALLNINTKTSAFYPEKRLSEFIADLERARRTDIHTLLKGLRVCTDYRLNRNNMANPPTPPIDENLFAIFDYTARQAGGITLNVNGPGVTMPTYFQNTYGVTVANNDRVVSVRGGSIEIPASLLWILPGQVLRLKADMATQATRQPQDNLSLILNEGKALFGLNPLQSAANGGVQPLFDGLSIDPNLLTVSKDLLNPPRVCLRDNSNQIQELPFHNRVSGSWNLKFRRFHTPAVGDYFSVLELRQPGTPAYADLQDYIRHLHKELQRYGITSQPLIDNNNDDTHSIEMPAGGADRNELIARAGRLRGAIAQLSKLNKNPKGGKLKLLFVLLHRQDVAMYALVKKACDQFLGVQTICHVSRKRKGQVGPAYDPGTIGNLALKFNLKMNPRGVNQSLKTWPELIKTGTTMVMGIDVTHPGPGAREGAPSIAALVGSVNDDFSQYPAVLMINPRRPDDPDPKAAQEKVLCLRQMAGIAIERWMLRHNNKLPSRLIIYRDGLSESQFSMCQNEEIPLIDAAIARIVEKQQARGEKNIARPNVLVVCTVKRHHTRFFRNKAEAKTGDVQHFDDKDNPMPGTLVSEEIVLGSSFNDFYLFSHGGLIGTSKPTHYVTLRNDLNASVLDIAEMTHGLCHVFGRATRSVSLATPAYYADLAADRARHYVRDIYNPRDRAPYDPAQHLMGLTLHNDIVESMFYI